MKFVLLWFMGIHLSQVTTAAVIAEYRPLGFGLNHNFEWVREVIKDDRVALVEEKDGLLKLTIEGIHVCGGWVKVSGDRFLSLLGEVPDTVNKPLLSAEIPDGAAEKEVLKVFASAELAASEVCWSAAGSQLEKKVIGQFESQGSPYSFEYFRGKLTYTRSGFDVTATIKAFPARINYGVPTNYTVATTEDGYLSDARLQANSYSSSGTIQRYNESSNVFDKSATVSDTDSFYDQSASFLYGARHFDFLKSQYAFEYYSNTPIQLIVGGVGTELNNAHFDPSTQPGVGGRIIIGQGQAPYLQNLGKDEDVVSHEIGHYLIFKWIYDVSSVDSKVLHEGLADFFVYDRTGDACLGESICPGALKCVTNSCLRVGNVDFKYGDDTWNKITEFHKKGQLIATALYNIRSKVPPGVAGKVAFKALSKVSPNCSIQQYVIALLHAEAELFSSANRADFLEQLRNAGFSAWLVGAETSLPPIPNVGGETPIATTTTKKTTAKKWWQFGCSAAVMDADREWYVIGVLLLPLLFVTLTRRRAKAHSAKL
ncbi:MAG: hypothetical protein WCI18_12880 [Pseudomonadota bacterium]